MAGEEEQYGQYGPDDLYREHRSRGRGNALDIQRALNDTTTCQQSSDAQDSTTWAETRLMRGSACGWETHTL